MNTNDLIEREIEIFATRNPKSKALQSRSENYLPGGSSRTTAYFHPFPHFIERGQGHYMFDMDGHQVLDFMINATSLIHGHADPDIVNALASQAGKGTAFPGPTESQIRLGEILTDRIPSFDRVRFTNSGTEGTLMAIRLSRAFTGKHKIAKFEGGYHGSHEYVSVSVHPPIEKLDPNGPTPIPEHRGMPPSILKDVIVLPYNDLDWCRNVLREQCDEIACLIMEPVVSSFGYLPADTTFLQGIREITNELGIILIFDEVQSFRLGPGGAQEVFGVIPDMSTLGKIIGGGMPVGAFGGREDIMSLLDSTSQGSLVHAGTFNANPMTMVAGEVAMSKLTPDTYERMNNLGEDLRSKLSAIFDEFEVPAKITGVGSLFGIHFTGENIRDYRTVIRANGSMNQFLFMGLLNEDVLLQSKTAGALNSLTTESHVDAIVDATRTVIQRTR